SRSTARARSPHGIISICPPRGSTSARSAIISRSRSSSSLLSSTSKIFRIRGFIAYRGSGSRWEFVSRFGEMVFLQLPIKRGASNAEQQSRGGAIALRVFERRENRIPFQLRQRNRRAHNFRAQPVHGCRRHASGGAIRGCDHIHSLRAPCEQGITDRTWQISLM